MQTGFRTDPIDSAKALRASLKTRKLDNAVYGSDLKFQQSLDMLTGTNASTQTGPTQVQATQTQGQPPVIDTSLPYVPLGASAFSPGASPTKSTISTYSAPTTKYEVKKAETAIEKRALLGRQVMDFIKPGVKPSAVKQKTKVEPTTVPVAQVSTASMPSATSPVGTTTSSGPQRLETKTEVPTSTAPQATPVNTSAEAIANTPAPTTKEALDPFPGAAEAFDEATKLVGTQPSLSNDNLQKLASMIVVISKGDVSATIPAYDKNGVESKDKIQIAKAGDGYSFTRKSGTEKTKSGSAATKLLKEAPSEGIDIAKTLTMGYDALVRHRGIVGIGLNSDERKKVHWAHRRSHADRYFVMYPAFRNGNVRFYASPKNQAVVSYNNASPHFLNIVRDVIDTGTFKTSDYSTLTPAESTAAHTFIKWAKPIIPRGAQFNTTDAGELFDMRNRYKVLVGELAAGNHGQAIKDEMMDILHTLQAKGALSRFKVSGLIKGLEEL
jgi:hypothetical protein